MAPAESLWAGREHGRRASRAARSTRGSAATWRLPGWRRPASTSCGTPRQSLRRDAGESIEAVSSFLDHSSLAVTSVYLRRLEGQEDRTWRDRGGGNRGLRGAPRPGGGVPAKRHSSRAPCARVTLNLRSGGGSGLMRAAFRCRRLLSFQAAFCPAALAVAVVAHLSVATKQLPATATDSEVTGLCNGQHQGDPRAAYKPCPLG